MNLQDSIRSAAGDYYFYLYSRGLYPRSPWTFDRVGGALGTVEKLLILARSRV